MLPVKQKEITDRIQKLGFRKSEFSFTSTGEESYELSYKPNAHYNFKVDHNLNHSGVPGSKGKHQFNGRANNWLDSLSTLEAWLRYVKENVDVGDPWQEVISEQQKLNEETFGNYDETLTEEEQKVFSNKLDLMLDHFSALQLDIGKMKDDIAHLKDQSSKISKKDLLLLFIGTVSSYMMAGIIPPNMASEVWHYIIDLFSISHNFLALQ